MATDLGFKEAKGTSHFFRLIDQNRSQKSIVSSLPHKKSQLILKLGSIAFLQPDQLFSPALRKKFPDNNKHKSAISKNRFINSILSLDVNIVDQ